MWETVGSAEEQTCGTVSIASKALQRKKREKIVFSDEKIFRIEQKLNAQKDRVYAALIEDLPEGLQAVRHEQFPDSVMVFAAASFDQKFPLKLVENGVKV